MMRCEDLMVNNSSVHDPVGVCKDQIGSGLEIFSAVSLVRYLGTNFLRYKSFDNHLHDMKVHTRVHLVFT